MWQLVMFFCSFSWFKPNTESVVEEVSNLSMDFFEILKTQFLDEKTNLIKDTFERESPFLTLIKAESQRLDFYYPKVDTSRIKLSKIDRIKLGTYCEFMYELEDVLDAVMKQDPKDWPCDPPLIIKLSLNLTLTLKKQENRTELSLGLLEEKEHIIHALVDAFGLNTGINIAVKDAAAHDATDPIKPC